MESEKIEMVLSDEELEELMRDLPCLSARNSGKDQAEDE